jgi:colicin import membrane protein
MKRNFLVLALLFSIIFWGVNAIAFAQDQVKDTVVKKADLKKDAMKKDMIKKGGIKKDEMKKVETTTTKEMKDGKVTKDETKKTVTTKKTEMKKDMNEVKTKIKDKEVGKTDDGKIIYEGPRGGKYTISESGKKVYLKKDAKEGK